MYESMKSKKKKVPRTTVKLIQFRVTEEEHSRMKVLCAELNITVQTFVRSLLRGALDREIFNVK